MSLYKYIFKVLKMNEFFRCPSYTYGIIVIAVLMYIVIYVYIKYLSEQKMDLMTLMNATGTVGLIMMAGGLMGGGWLLWTLWNWVFRHADCDRVGSFKGDFRNPFA